MKTTTNLNRLISTLALIIIMQVNISSEEFEPLSSEVMYYSYIHDYPINFNKEIEIHDWMICECAFENNEFYQCISLEWLTDDEGTETLFCYPYSADSRISEYQSFLDDMMGYSTELTIMKWMLDFEPMVVDVLLKDVKPNVYDKWMIDGNFFLDYEHIDPEFADWMLAEDFDLNQTQIVFEPWMIAKFSVN